MRPARASRVIGEAENIPPGGGTALDLDLDRGSYLAICNIRGHFAWGMFAPFTVR